MAATSTANNTYVPNANRNLVRRFSQMHRENKRQAVYMERGIDRELRSMAAKATGLAYLVQDGIGTLVGKGAAKTKEEPIDHAASLIGQMGVLEGQSRTTLRTEDDARYDAIKRRRAEMAAVVQAA